MKEISKIQCSYKNLMKKISHLVIKKRFVLILLLQTCILVSVAADQDESMEIDNVSDIQFNNNPEAIFVNGIFVKNIIGVRMDKSIINVSKEKCVSPLKINGVTYAYKCNLISDKAIRFVSLEDIKKKYCPNVTAPCLYMINKNFIFKDVDSYKIDKDFVLRVEIVSSLDFVALKHIASFTIIRIFTDIKSNRNPMRLK